MRSPAFTGPMESGVPVGVAVAVAGFMMDR